MPDDVDRERHLLVHRRHPGREVFIEPVATTLGVVGGEDDEAALIDLAEDFLHRTLRMLHVMNREGSHRTIEASSWKRKRFGIASNPPHAIALEARLRKHRRGEFEPIHARAEVLQRDGVVAGPTSDIEVARARGEIQMTQEAAREIRISFAGGVVGAPDGIIEWHWSAALIRIPTGGRESRQDAFRRR